MSFAIVCRQIVLAVLVADKGSLTIGNSFGFIVAGQLDYMLSVDMIKCLARSKSRRERLIKRFSAREILQFAVIACLKLQHTVGCKKLAQALGVSQIRVVRKPVNKLFEFHFCKKLFVRHRVNLLNSIFFFDYIISAKQFRNNGQISPKSEISNSFQKMVTEN